MIKNLSLFLREKKEEEISVSPSIPPFLSILGDEDVSGKAKGDLLEIEKEEKE